MSSTTAAHHDEHHDAGIAAPRADRSGHAAGHHRRR